jgi:phosphohistidine swiveling domain-containing protein
VARYRAAVVSAGGTVTGVIGEDIAVLPDMHPTRSGQAWDARAVVAEVGGPLAHMAVVAREMNKTMMVLPDACELLHPGMRVTLVPARCEILTEEDTP